MSDIYRDHLLDHARRPRHYGVLSEAQFFHHEANPSCGDVIEVYVDVDGDDRITRASFTGHGCVISQAATSMFIESIAGKSTQQILAMTAEDVVGLLGVAPGPMRMNCALLPLRAVQKVLANVK